MKDPSLLPISKILFGLISFLIFFDNSRKDFVTALDMDDLYGYLSSNIFLLENGFFIETK